MDGLRQHLRWEDFEFQVLYRRHGREYSIRNRHAHDFYELVVVREGSAFHGFGGEKHRLSPGDVFLVLPGETHYYFATARGVPRGGRGGGLSRTCAGRRERTEI